MRIRFFIAWLLVGLLGACASTGPITSAPERAALIAAPAAASAANTIVIDNFTFMPQELTIPVGTKVTWVNRDDVPHTVTSTTEPRTLNSPVLDTDGRFEMTFTAAGTYPYYCTVHPHMTAKIIVK